MKGSEQKIQIGESRPVQTAIHYGRLAEMFGKWKAEKENKDGKTQNQNGLKRSADNL